MPPPPREIEFVDVHVPVMFSVAPTSAPKYGVKVEAWVMAPDQVLMPDTLWITPPAFTPNPEVEMVRAFATVMPPESWMA